MKTRVFTVEEANFLVPIIAPLIEELQKQNRKMQIMEYDISLTDLLKKNRIRMASCNLLSERWRKHNKQVIEINLLLSKLHDYGCIIKDLDVGTVDFLAEVNDHPVFLCWKLGEEEIAYYHELDEEHEERRHIWF